MIDMRLNYHLGMKIIILNYKITISEMGILNICDYILQLFLMGKGIRSMID